MMMTTMAMMTMMMTMAAADAVDGEGDDGNNGDGDDGAHAQTHALHTHRRQSAAAMRASATCLMSVPSAGLLVGLSV